MSEAAVFLQPTKTIQSDGRVLVVGIALASFASLLLELALTRLFSVVLFYHFAFLAISIALLGLGAAGVYAHLRREWLARWRVRRIGAVICVLNSAAILVALEVVLHVPVSLDVSWGNFGRLTAMYVAATLPFFLTGVLFSTTFAREPQAVTQLYAADLIGGAVSCLAIVPLLNWVGGPNAIVFAALTTAVAATIWADARQLRSLAALVGVLLIVVLAANHSGRLIDVVYAKGMRRDQPWVLFARWNALSRVEVDQVGSGKYIVIDADASTAIMNVDPQKWSQTLPPVETDRVAGARRGYNWKEDLMSAAPAVANVLRPRGTYAIIGPGGGVDVLRAVANGSPSVSAIEINPLIANTIMRALYADYSHHLYELPQVHMHVGDGRSWIRGSKERHDVLQMTLVDTWASTAAGAFALSENNLYTVEAFREYFDHLKSDGFIAITRWEFRQPREALRVVSQAITALEQIGVKDAGKHFIVVSDGPLDEDGRPVTVLAKKTPFTWSEERDVLRHLDQNGNLYPLYTPTLFGSFTEEQSHDEPWAAELLKHRRASGEAVAAFERLIRFHREASLGHLRFSPRGEFIRNYPSNIAPVSDDAPFFFFTFKARDALENALRGTGRGMDWKNNLGVMVLGAVLLISLAAVLVFLVGPLVVQGQTFSAVGAPNSMLGTAPTLLYFVALGLGYILVEVALIQRFVLFLGHPTYALTVVVFLMLLASGAGSAASRHLLRTSVQVRPVLMAIVVFLAAYIVLLPGLMRTFIGMPLWTKLLMAGLLLAPLGFVMGMPFPAGLRQIAIQTLNGKTQRPSSVEWAWALNAGSSVLGSALAMVVAVAFGLSAVLALGAASYFLAILVTATWACISAEAQ
jgi:hypothetical protein